MQLVKLFNEDEITVNQVYNKIKSLVPDSELKENDNQKLIIKLHFYDKKKKDKSELIQFCLAVGFKENDNSYKEFIFEKEVISSHDHPLKLLSFDVCNFILQAKGIKKIDFEKESKEKKKIEIDETIELKGNQIKTFINEVNNQLQLKQ